jgi:tRNA threonylcarbamoyladenosine modification (KEOPS) complex Cgi121 subunit
MGSQYRDDIIVVGSLKAKIISMTFSNSNVKHVYQEIKANPNYNKKIDLVFLNSKLVFGLEHILGIMKILGERKKRNIISDIKNLEIEFLMRVCCTDQISEALRVNFGDRSNKEFVVIIISADEATLQEIEKEFARYGISEHDESGNTNNIQTSNKDLIAVDTYKRDYIIDQFFREKIKDSKSPILKSNTEFLKFLVERAAISIS